MKKLSLVLLVLFSSQLFAAGGAIELESARIDLDNKASLQRGAKYFVNYCLSCHSAKQLRYSRMAKDLEIPPELVELNLMFTGEKIFDGMTISMRPEDAVKWFGVNPPDLSLIARSRGSDWLYTYLKSFYVDASRPFGVDNALFPKVGMPHVLADLQGMQQAVYKDVELEDGSIRKVIDRLEIVEPGRMTEKEFDKAMNDLVNFMTYMGEPAKLERQRLGWKVLMFIFLMIVVFYFLKKEYWKDVH
ncbi:cytochrome c1 [Cycloclasticus pugetii]|jgi:ubiquinol-cytochrome c reductase cytochrome c1 subunit|uniref:cytochrome c1 n=1 Tax=Cycloclasticus pugetii TaxID=34068 RepID=UPI002409133D|nr:cytochrome c1 [Cycloclasticus pugetii]MDF1828750.1 cytochrome c1 [Cycloclasticus pugetii]